MSKMARESPAHKTALGQPTPPPSPPSIRGLSNRLKLKSAMARRLAIRDLIARQDEPGAVQALATHLTIEADERALLLLIESLGEHRLAPAFDALVLIRDQPQSSAPVAHAARLACDRIERAAHQNNLAP